MALFLDSGALSSSEMPTVPSTTLSASSSSSEIPTATLFVIISETPTAAINPAAQPSTTLIDTPYQFNTIIGVGVTGAFVFGIFVSVIAMVVVTLACRIKKSIVGDNVAAHQCVEAANNSEGNSGNSVIYSL